MQQLSSLYLSDNLLDGCIPAELGTLRNLTYLWIGGNKLTGPLPDFLSGLKSLKKLHIGNNRFSGPISEVVSSRFINFWSIDLSHNAFTGKIPDTLWNAGKLEELFLNDTQFDAFEIPDTVGKSLKILDISNTKVFGRLPVALAYLNDLKELKVDGTNLEKIVNGSFTFCPFWAYLRNNGFESD
ncbi:L domain-like protein [Rhizoclosmatium globosum]|uniref:non-specific serine/threonine protein kinase n=1 Tax=Rhizoclosmatium globosum TaxID=329046 RepID=A0A1Y2B7C3_9FUNG|nr:L domain-like protein [Rhizoclosmatium globosum]|eukprot:ORY30738.1 L domain-like protein [Rhizoclosmatium globosum]